MKKFMKTCAVIALVMIILGIALGIAGSSVAGRSTISQVVETVTGGRVRVDFGEGWGIFRKVEFGDNVELDLGGLSGLDVNYSIGDTSMFSRDQNILSGDVEMYCPGDGIKNLEIQVGGCHLGTKVSKDGSVYLEAKNVRKFQGYVEDDTLYVKSTMGSGASFFDGKSEITLYLPEGYGFQEAEIDMGAGEMELEWLKAEEASLEVGAGRISLKSVEARELSAEVGAGQIELKNMSVGELDVEVGMGEFVAEGTVRGNADVECSMGNVEMKLDGRQEDYNYKLEGAMGNIQLGKESVGGFAQDRTIDNGADKTMEIGCSMGNITIRFRD